MVGRRALAEGVVEAQARRSGAEHRLAGRRGGAPGARAARAARAEPSSRVEAPPASASTAPGPPPGADAPRRSRCDPLDDPEPGRLRCASPAIPVFLSSPSTPATAARRAAAILFLAIAAGDYLDGFLARVTGQYSRLGALLDPLVDRLTILAGVVVCWHFELLPRWALAVLAARELVDARPRPVRRCAAGSSSRSTGSGGSSVFPIMGGIFFALVVDWLGRRRRCSSSASLWSLLATALYARTGLRGGAPRPRHEGRRA